MTNEVNVSDAFSKTRDTLNGIAEISGSATTLLVMRLGSPLLLQNIVDVITARKRISWIQFLVPLLNREITRVVLIAICFKRCAYVENA